MTTNIKLEVRFALLLYKLLKAIIIYRSRVDDNNEQDGHFLPLKAVMDESAAALNE